MSGIPRVYFKVDGNFFDNHCQKKYDCQKNLLEILFFVNKKSKFDLLILMDSALKKFVRDRFRIRTNKSSQIGIFLLSFSLNSVKEEHSFSLKEGFYTQCFLELYFLKQKTLKLDYKSRTWEVCSIGQNNITVRLSIIFTFTGKTNSKR